MVHRTGVKPNSASVISARDAFPVRIFEEGQIGFICASFIECQTIINRFNCGILPKLKTRRRCIFLLNHVGICEFDARNRRRIPPISVQSRCSGHPEIFHHIIKTLLYLGQTGSLFNHRTDKGNGIWERVEVTTSRWFRGRGAKSRS